MHLMKSPSFYVLLSVAAILAVELASSGFDPVRAAGASLPIFVLLAQLSLPVLMAAVAFRERKIPFLDEIAKDGQKLAFLASSTAMLGSLFYQFGDKLVPCELCWFQRIFMYPLVFIIGVSLWKKQEDVFDYALPLCVMGGVISLYHYYVQFLSAAVTCSDGGSCSQIQVASFGYMTIPLMALTAFVSIAILLYLKKRGGKGVKSV
jgi:disulfide bond formation protein DsbB